MENLHPPNRNQPFSRSQRQCNWILQPILGSHYQVLIGFIQCPRDVFAEYAIESSVVIDVIDERLSFAELSRIAQGWYCEQHFLRMISSRARQRQNP